MAFILKATQQVDLSVTVTDKRGNAAQVENGTWEVDSESVATITDNGNGTATLKAVGTPGTAVVSYTADADLGDGVQEVEGYLDLEVVAGDAAVFNIVAGTPSEQPDAPTA